MLCKNCGAQIADDSVFCTNCGFRVRPVSEAAQENAAVTAEQIPVQTEQAVQDSATAENTAQMESIQESAAAENTQQTEPIQESVDAENGTQAEDAAQEGAADGQAQPSGELNGQAQADSMSGEQPQMNGAPSGQMPYGQPQMNGVPSGQMSYGPPQMNGVPNGQMPYGQPQMNGMPNGQMSYGQPQMNGMPNGQMPYGQPQMSGMSNGQMPYGQPQMNGVPNGQIPYGQPQMNGVPNGQMPYGRPQAGSIPNGMPYGQALKPPKKPFVMPAAVNVVGGILAIAAVAVCVCVFLFGKPEEKKSDMVVSTLAIPAQQQAVGGSDYLTIDLSNVTYQLEIPETDGYRAAQELAEGYIFADSDTRYLRESDLYTYSHSDLWHAYYEIIAREGVDLSEIDSEEHEYFQGKNWYNPTISLLDVLIEMDEDQIECYSEMIENEEDPSYAILLDAGILNETEAFNMKLIEEYLLYGLTTMDEPEDALEDMLEE